MNNLKSHFEQKQINIMHTTSRLLTHFNIAPRIILNIFANDELNEKMKS